MPSIVSGGTPRRLSPMVLIPWASARSPAVTTNGSTSCAMTEYPPMNACLATRQNWWMPENAPMLASSPTSTWPAIDAAFAKTTRSPTRQSCATCAAAMNSPALPTRVTPPPGAVPRLIVTYSRIWFPSPMTTSVGSPLYLRSCGGPPSEANGATTLSAPSVARPSITTWDFRTVRSPTTVSGPKTQ